MDCEQCGRCCRYLVLPYDGSTTFDDPLWGFRGIKFLKGGEIWEEVMILPCACRYVFEDPWHPDFWVCSLHNTKEYPEWCREQEVGRPECMMLHEVFP